MSTVYSSSQYNNYTYFTTPFQQQPYIGPAAPPVVPPPYSVVPSVYSLPQYQHAQQFFQKVAQTITPEAIENVKAALASNEIEQKAEAKKKAVPRKAAGQTWEDPTLAEWPENDYRLFCGNLGNEVNDDVLSKAFSRFPSFNMARVVRDKRTGKTKGYGFVSFSNPSDLVGALKEMNVLLLEDLCTEMVKRCPLLEGCIICKPLSSMPEDFLDNPALQQLEELLLKSN